MFPFVCGAINTCCALYKDVGLHVVFAKVAFVKSLRTTEPSGASKWLNLSKTESIYIEILQSLQLEKTFKIIWSNDHTTADKRQKTSDLLNKVG